MTTLPEEAKEAAAQADYEARILSALEPSAARELAFYEGDDICARLEGLAFWLDGSQHSKWCGRKEVPIHGYSGEGKLVRAAIAAIRALSYPDHADAGKVEGDGSRWRIFEAACARGYWGIELEQASNDDEPILYPIKVHRDTLVRIVEAHNAGLPSAPASEGAE